MHWSLGVLVQIILILTTGLWPAGASSSLSQVDTSLYVPSTVSGIMAQHGIEKHFPNLGLQDIILIPPGSRYRLDLEATGQIRELSEEYRPVLDMWSKQSPGLPDFVRVYTHQVEVKTENGPLWILWQQTLVKPFQEERSAGGRIRVYAHFACVFHRQPLLLVTMFQSMN